MTAMAFEKQGGAEVLEYRELPNPKAGPGQVVVRLRAASVNRLDIWIRQRLPGVEPIPHVVGSDGAGEVAEVGPGVTDMKVGDRVCIYNGLSCGRCEYCVAGEENVCARFQLLGWKTQGTYAQKIALPAANVVPMPPNVTFEKAAAFPLTFLTSWHLLVTQAGLRAGERVLVHAAGSGIGSAAIQIAKLCGATVIATAGSEAKLKKARELGADATALYTTPDWPEAVLKWTDGRGVDVVFEHIGPPTFEPNMSCMANNGRMLVVGASAGPRAEFELRPLYMRQLRIIGSILGTRRELMDVARLVAEGKLKVVIDSTFALKDAGAAHHRMESRDLFGKIVLTI
jgi:NADPH:quinone reductase-like Zn-dependent oxidoreductase